jgi:predicted Fe-Mo cluster-binding NifX family protein
VHEVSTVENPYYGHHQPGQVPGFIDSQGVDVMLSGGMGRRAIGFFQQYGIQAVTGATGSVRHALEQYLGGTIQVAEPCRESIKHAHEEAANGALHPGRQVEGGYEKDKVGRLREKVQILEQQLTEVMERLTRLTSS